jgi:Sulfotransferase domain
MPIDQSMIVALWSAPRSRSTAFERMMHARGDFTVLHEPFSHVANYGSTTVDGEVITTEPQLLAVLQRMRGRVFFKDTTDFHYPRLLEEEAFLRNATHTFLVRHPREAIASHFALHPGLGRDEIGFAWLYEIFAAVRAATGATPVVVDSADLVARPAETVERYCAAVGIPFVPTALNWSTGMKPTWLRSERWHQSTSETTGFVQTLPRTSTAVEDSPLLAGYLEYHLPFYESLWQHRIRLD